ncbi:MAG: glutaredoxin 3 [Polyangiaceae bacterium]|nr:glutaredoxin 3 [Polyangiaceae bacterium]
MSEVVIYTSPTCGYCLMAVRLLRDKGVAFRQENVAGDPERRKWLAKVTGRSTVPQIFIGGEPIGGYTDLAALERSGKLDTMLGLATT